MKLVLSAAAVLLFTFGYQVCSYFYDPCKQVSQWWDLRMNLYSILILLCFVFSNMKVRTWEINHIKFVIGIGLGLSISDVIDRLLFDITRFQTDDIIMVIFTLLISALESYTKYNTSRLNDLCLKCKK